MNDTPVDPDAVAAAIAAAVAPPIPSINDSIARLVKAHDSVFGAMNRVATLADHVAGPPNPARAASTLVADNRPGLAATLANIVAQFEETASFVVEEVVAIERAIG